MRASTSTARSPPSRSAPASWPRAGSISARFAFSASFARNLDYYTGFIFEVQDLTPQRTASRWSAAAATTGCFEHLGADAPIPAVGCSFWLDRIVRESA